MGKKSRKVRSDKGRPRGKYKVPAGRTYKPKKKHVRQSRKKEDILAGKGYAQTVRQQNSTIAVEKEEEAQQAVLLAMTSSSLDPNANQSTLLTAKEKKEAAR